jgi:uncharacterized membrane-anchored protein
MELTIGDRVTIEGIEYGIDVVDGEPELVEIERRLVAGDCLNIDGNYYMLVHCMNGLYLVVRLSTGERIVDDRGISMISRPYISEIKRKFSVNKVKFVTREMAFTVVSRISQE